MTTFANQNLQTCNKNSTALSDNDIGKLLNELDSWALDASGECSQLYKAYSFKDFVSAQAFANKVADLAEQENHHPRICIEWGKTTISWWTHSVSGLFINDFIMAARCDLNNT